MSKPSKNMPVPISSMMRRWNLEMGSRSRRAPESAVTVSSLFPREQGQSILRQGVNGEAAVLVKEVLLGVEKKAFAATHGGRVEPQDTLDQGFGFGGEAIGGTDLRDQTDLLRAMRVDGLTEQNKWKCEAGKRVFTEIGHDGGRGETGTHLGESEGGVLRDEREVAHDREAEAEAERVAVDLRDADQRTGPQGGFELEDTSRFTTDCRRGAASALASRAKNVAAPPNAQDAGAGL